MTLLPVPATIWPAQLPRLDLEVTLVLLNEKDTTALSIWLVHAVPAAGEPYPTWQPVKAWTKRIGNRHQVMFWRRVVTPAEWLALLDGVANDGTFATNTGRIAMSVVPRPPVQLAASGDEKAMPPIYDEAAWLWEWWDADKTVKTLLSEERRRLVNTQVRVTLGLDLDHWKDRIGNILVFFPSGLRTRWHYDPASHSLVVQTTLPPDEATAHEVEVRGWEDGDLMLARRITLERSSVMVPDVPPCDRFEVWVWRDGRLVHREDSHVFLKALSFRMDVHVGFHGGRSYTRRASESRVGRDDVEPWARLQRERQVDNRRAELARGPSLKFYAPDGTEVQRTEAVGDMARILASARHSLRLWDPYFGTNAGDTTNRGTPEDDLYFIESITRLDVSVRVLSSTEDWTAAQGSARVRALTARLEAEHAAAPGRFGRVAWKVWVRADVTTFHDRFIVVDDTKVWLLGSSINGLGKKHTTLVQLEYPQEILVAFDRIWRGETHGVGQLLSVFEPQGARRGP